MAKADGEFKPKKAKAKKGGSKKPLSGFMLFSKEHRAKIKEGTSCCLSARWLCLLVCRLHNSSHTNNSHTNDNNHYRQSRHYLWTNRKEVG